MNNIKVRNVLYSLVVLLICFGVIFCFSADELSRYVWLKMLSVCSEIGAGLFFLLRIVRVIKFGENLPYCFFGMANLLLGLYGVFAWILGKMNVAGLHGLLINLLIGVIILSDIFLFQVVTGKRSS